MLVLLDIMEEVDLQELFEFINSLSSRSSFAPLQIYTTTQIYIQDIIYLHKEKLTLQETDKCAIAN